MLQFKKENEPAETLHTKWGTAKIGNHGYYQITNNGENHLKLLHRLIFEDAYGPIPKDCVLHHKDHVKTNNSLENIILMSRSEHMSLHTKGENNINYNKTGNDHPKAIQSARVVKNGFYNGRQKYSLIYDGIISKTSINKEMLEMMNDEINSY